jgi:glycosyltransferase involved in cell wall biosynthesis
MNPSTPSPVAVVINTLNEEANLPGCLESVRWAAEIIVVDMHSDDATARIAADFGCRVFQHERTGYVEPARNFGLAQATQPWVLVLDADERVSPALKTWMETTLAATTAAAFRIPRRNYYDGRWITCCGWFPDDQLRLFRRGVAQYSDRIHRAPKIEGLVADLPQNGDACLEHYGFSTLTARLDKDNLYSDITAQAMIKEGRRVSVFGVLARPVAAFCTAYFLQGGFRFGAFGAVLAWERAFATFSKYAKLWERQQKRAGKTDVSTAAF